VQKRVTRAVGHFGEAESFSELNHFTMASSSGPAAGLGADRGDG
jgi:hypothetical protein